MTTQEIYIAGQQLTRKYMTMCHNAQYESDIEDFSMREYLELGQRFVNFCKWALLNGMKANICDFLSNLRGTTSESRIAHADMMQTLEMAGINIYE